MQGIVGFFNQLPGQLQAAFASLIAFAQGAWTAIANAAASAANAISDVFSAAVGRVTGFFAGFRDRAMSILNAIAERLRSVAQQVSEAGSGGGGGGGEGFASGGLIRGPGSGTSDPIPIWASNREYVMRRRAVDFWGVGFMQAINSLRNPFAMLGDRIARFNAGGLVDFSSMMPSIPRFADGGLVTAGAAAGKQPVNIHFGGDSFAALVDDDVLQRMARAAVRHDVKSSGRKPTWYRG